MDCDISEWLQNQNDIVGGGLWGHDCLARSAGTVRHSRYPRTFQEVEARPGGYNWAPLATEDGRIPRFFDSLHQQLRRLAGRTVAEGCEQLSQNHLKTIGGLVR